MALLDDVQNLKILDLIEPLSQDFAFRGWQRRLDNVRCFRVVGLDEVLSANNIRHADIYGKKEFSAKANEKIPAQWKQEFPTNDNGWKHLKRDQFTYAYQKLPMRLDKACHAVLVACAALDHTGVTFQEFFDYVKIRPQIYFIDGFTLEFYNAFIRNTVYVDQLRDGTGLYMEDQLIKIASRHCVTKRTAIAMADILSPVFRVIRGVTLEPNAPQTLIDEVINYDPAQYGLPVLEQRARAGGAGPL